MPFRFNPITDKLDLVSTGGGGSGIITLAGDVGTATGSTVNIITSLATNGSGSISFNNFGVPDTLFLSLADNFNSIYLGSGAGNPLGTPSSTATGNISLGVSSFGNVTTSPNNVGIGDAALSGLQGGNGSNVGVGTSVLQSVVSGDTNIAIGTGAGGGYTGAESSNILIGNNGTVGESNKIRIGTQGTSAGQQNACYVAGITGVSVSNTNMVTIDTSTGQLGSQAIPGGSYISLSPYIVGTDANSGYATIALGIAAAVTGGATDSTPMNVYVKPKADGTAYTENFTLAPGVNLVGFGKTVTINGKIAMTATGSVSITGFTLQTNSDFIISVTGSSNSTVQLIDCALNCSNNTGINNASSGSSAIYLYNTVVDVGTTGIALYSIAAASGGLQFHECQLTNSGASTTASNVSAGSVNFFHTDVFIPISTSSSGFGTIYNSVLNTSNENMAFLTMAGTGNYLINNSSIYSGTASTISVGSGTTVTCTTSTLSSSNTDVIAGSGTLNYGALTCTDSSTLAGTLTANSLTTIPSGGAGVTTIAGDSGTATGSTVTLNANSNSGSTVNFVASSSTVDLKVADANTNIIIGPSAGNGSITGNNNIALGYRTFFFLTSGVSNLALGSSALISIGAGNNNVALGDSALSAQSSGNNNTAVGAFSLEGGSSGSNNIGIGFGSGGNYAAAESSNVLIANAGTASENNTIHIGTQGTGDGQQNSCFIAGITGATVTGSAVLCDTNGQLGTVASSERYKTDIKSLSSESMLDLRPVSFKYKGDRDIKTHYGMIAEEVDKVFPDLVIYDQEGRPHSIAYHEMPALLLKEIQRLNDRIKALENK